ncbi:MAG: toxin-activating lysine-acyltransferase [Desulfurivibrionaceae bacterium]|jgi:cytolysin-activating lysine-acyltransferase
MRFNTPNSLDIIAPGLIEENWTEAEVFGSAAWLWMHSSSHRERPLHTLSALLLPAIKQQQFILASEVGQPVFYLAWANLSLEAEQRYLQQHPVFMPEADWNSGERMWVLDWVAPFGHTRIMHRLLERQLFANRCMRALYHRGDERGLKIKTFRGMAVLPEEAQAWFQHHPLALNVTENPIISQ